MTLQAGDKLHYENQEWFIQGASGEFDFNLADYGLECAGGYSTGCYRGFCYEFEIRTNKLMLKELEINLPEKYYFEVEPPEFCGQKPIVYDWALAMKLGKDAPPSPTCGDFRYTNLNFPLSYTGGLLLRDTLKVSISTMLNLMQNTPVRESFRVAEMIIEEGQLISFKDCSKMVAEKINHFHRQKNNNDITSIWALKEITQLFQFDYFL